MRVFKPRAGYVLRLQLTKAGLLPVRKLLSLWEGPGEGKIAS